MGYYLESIRRQQQQIRRQWGALENTLTAAAVPIQLWVETRFFLLLCVSVVIAEIV